MAAWADVAEIRKVRANGKGFVVRRTAGLLYWLQPCDEVFFVPPKLDLPRSAFVVSSNPIDERSASVTFDIPLVAHLQDMVGMHCLVSRDGRRIEETHDQTLSGYTVLQEDGSAVGVVKEVDASGLQPRLLVESNDGRELMIPFVDELIRSINDDLKVVSVKLPAGLLDL